CVKLCIRFICSTFPPAVLGWKQHMCPGGAKTLETTGHTKEETNNTSHIHAELPKSVMPCCRGQTGSKLVKHCCPNNWMGEVARLQCPPSLPPTTKTDDTYAVFRKNTQNQGLLGT
ncbi:unnamed protein product, partial [Ectocarpus sp. 8 AP-2014]